MRKAMSESDMRLKKRKSKTGKRAKTAPEAEKLDMTVFFHDSAGLVQQDKLEPSEQLGDLLKRAGDNEAALQCYQKANVTQKVVEGLAAKGDFAELTRFSGTQVWHRGR